MNPVTGGTPVPPPNPEEPMWEALIGKIIDGKVIPVIGPDFLTDGSNIHLQLINALANWFKVTTEPSPTTFSELVYDEDYLKNNT